MEDVEDNKDRAGMARSVRLERRTHNMVKVHISRSYKAITKSNCVIVRWGGEQLEVKDQAVG